MPVSAQQHDGQVRKREYLRTLGESCDYLVFYNAGLRLEASTSHLTQIHESLARAISSPNEKIMESQHSIYQAKDAPSRESLTCCILDIGDHIAHLCREIRA